MPIPSYAKIAMPKNSGYSLGGPRAGKSFGFLRWKKRNWYVPIRPIKQRTFAIADR